MRHIAITSLVLGFWLAAGAAQAASVTFDFSGEYLEGGQPGTGEDVSLLLSLDESSALNNGDQLSANAVLEFEGYDPVTFDIFNVEAFLGWNLEPPPVIYLLSSAYDNSTLGLGLSSISGAALNSVSALVTAVQAEDLVVFYEIDLTAFNGQNALEGSFALVGISEVPLPAAMWLFASGLAGFVAISRRRQSRA